jgi:hypothetical protein
MGGYEHYVYLLVTFFPTTQTTSNIHDNNKFLTIGESNKGVKG